MPPVSLERVVSPNPAVESVKSNDSDKTLSGSSDSIGTAYRMDSQVLFSTLFWLSLIINYLDQDSTTSVEGDGLSTWSSGRQMSIREWDIPYEELRFTIICINIITKSEIDITLSIVNIVLTSSYLQTWRQNRFWQIFNRARWQLARRRRHQVP